MSKIPLNFFKSLPAHEKKITIPTLLTISRIALIPFILFCMMQEYWRCALALFFLAAITDMLDGYLARIFNERTFLGACLDPCADKLLIISSLFVLSFKSIPYITPLPVWFVLLITVKELLIIAGAVFIYYYKGSIIIQPTRLGKITAFAQICLIIGYSANFFIQRLPFSLYYTALAGIIILLTASLIQYIHIGLNQLLSDKYL